MDAFALVLIGSFAALIIWIWLLGRYYPGSGLESVGLRSAGEITESREALEAEDLNQMLAVHNARRRRRGKPEVTVSDLEREVSDGFNEQRRRREEYLADRDLEELLEVTNARRRARGLAERGRRDVQREFGGPPACASEPRAPSSGPRAPSPPPAPSSGPPAPSPPAPSTPPAPSA